MFIDNAGIGIHLDFHLDFDFNFNYYEVVVSKGQQ